MIDDIMLARHAVQKDLKQRAQKKDPNVGTGKGFYFGSGVIECPVCKKGKLRYSRSSRKGHIHAVCSTDYCVHWME